MKIKIWTLVVDTPDGKTIYRSAHPTEEAALEELADNHLHGEYDGDDPIYYATEEASMVVHLDEHTLDVPLEIIHGRDPDSSCELTIFAQGERTDDYSEVDLDPGKGWLRSDWELYKQEATTGGTPAFNAAVAAEFEAFDGSQYIEED